MADSEVITAQDGDTLCTLAIAAGFRDCTPLRADPANAGLLNRPLAAGDQVTIPARDPGNAAGGTDARHRFRRRGRRVGIRFVHGSRSRPYADDLELTELNVSNYITDQGGVADGNAAFPSETVRVFNAAADQDPDAFKVEVLDTSPPGNPIQVDIQPLRPVYSAADPTGRTVTNLVEFPAAERARRSLLSIDAARQGGSQRFRTCYLRLVTDDADNNDIVGPQAPNGFAPATVNHGRVLQTILATDMVDEGDPQVEILDQMIEAKYTLTSCPNNPACAVAKRVPIGTDRRRLRIAVHILRRTPAGTPVATIAEADRRVKRWLRRIFAQAAISPTLVQATREVNPLGNIVSVSEPPPNAGPNAGGSSASGVTAGGAASQVQFRINAAGRASQVVGPITPVDAAGVGFTPIQTANALAALVAAPYSATVSQNPPRFNDAVGSVDIIITENSGLAVTIDQLPTAANADTAQTLTVGNVNPLPVALQAWDGQNFLVGSLQQRVILKNYDTGDDRVDIFIIDTVTSGDRGEAMMAGDEVNPANPAINGVKWSVFMIRDAIRNPGNPDNDPLVLAHELTHVVAEVIHTDNAGVPATTPNPHQLMARQVTGSEAVGGSKRLRDGPCTYDSPATANPVNIVARLRAKGAPLLEPW